MAKTSSQFLCSECGWSGPKWLGRCPECGQWGTIEEFHEARPAAGSRTAAPGRTSRTQSHPVASSAARPITDIGTENISRIATGFSEFDRVLGGGIVPGSVTLIAGEPGIGKSTLMLQICGKLSETAKILYVSGEESPRQLKLRADRLGVQSDNLYVLSETCLGDVLESVEEEKPDVLIVDSIQTLYQDSLESPAGSVAQVRACTLELMQLAKGEGITVFVTTHFMDEAEYCDRISIMVDGVIRALDTPGELKRQFNATTMDDVFQQLARQAVRTAD